MTPITHKVGRVTTALGLIGFGGAMLYDNLLSTDRAALLFLKLWPLLLIGFGLEYLVRSALAQRSEQDVKLRLDIAGAFLLVLVVLLTAGITTFRNWVAVEEGRLSFAAGPSLEHQESFTIPAEEIQALEVRADVGRVTIREHTRSDEILVEATYTAHGFILDRDVVRRQLEDIDLKVTEGATVRLQAEVPRSLENVSISYQVYAPPDIKVKADTGVGSIHVLGYAGELQLTSRVGRIDVNAGSGTLSASSGSGSITIRNFAGAVAARANVGAVFTDSVTGPQQLNSETGSITVRDFHGGPLVAETNLGRIDASTRTVLEGDVTLKTSTGSISLTVPEESSFRATIQTRTGSISAPEFMTVTRQGTSRTAVGTAGDGEHTITLEATTGSVHFQMPELR